MLAFGYACMWLYRFTCFLIRSWFFQSSEDCCYRLCSEGLLRPDLAAFQTEHGKRKVAAAVGTV